MTSLREVETEGVAAVCATDGGTFPFSALRVDVFGAVWHDGFEFDGDIVCHGPFSLHAAVSSPANDAKEEFCKPVWCRNHGGFVSGRAGFLVRAAEGARG